MAGDSNAGIIRENTIDPFSHGIGSVGDDNLAGVQGISDADAAAMMKRNPTGPRSRIEKRVQNWPVGNGIAAVFHRLVFPERGSHGATIQMIAANNNRRRNLPRLDKMVDPLAKLSALSISQPADPRRQTLKMNLLPRQRNPAVQDFVMR